MFGKTTFIFALCASLLRGNVGTCASLLCPSCVMLSISPSAGSVVSHLVPGLADPGAGRKSFKTALRLQIEPL